MKTHALYTCRRCGTNTPRWQGRCGTCDEWNSIDDVPTTSAPRGSRVVTTSLRDVADEDSAVTPSGVGELDRVLGGGFVAGSTTLLYGEPGVGKSTLALMTLRALALSGADVVLIASEESAAQVAQRARRFGEVPTGLDVAITTNVHSAEALLRERRRTLCVVDSISAMSDDTLASAVGSVPQIRNAAERLCSAAKATGSALLLIGHVTKDGELAGPRALEHLVDTVVRIEGERQGTLRLLRAQKHRFGPTGEVGLFEMVGEGLLELNDASRSLRGPQLDVPGVVLTVTNDGSRSFLVEI
ncbi:MAG TPA: ATPase domain-containing protein, partial [Acidimicrobiales bacterium]|nr:ATPase domain-containing protein [Acidimicrobiales bacterium]